MKTHCGGVTYSIPGGCINIWLTCPTSEITGDFLFSLKFNYLNQNKKKNPHHLIRAYVSCHSQRGFCEHRMSLYLVTSHPDCREKHFLAWRYIILFLLWVLFAGCGGRWQTITNWSDVLWLRPAVLGVNRWSCDWLLALKAKIHLYKHVTTPHPKGVTATGNHYRKMAAIGRNGL